MNIVFQTEIFTYRFVCMKIKITYNIFFYISCFILSSYVSCECEHILYFTHNPLLLPQQILPIGSPGQTVEQFFDDVAAPLAESSSKSNMKLDKALLGRSNDNLNEIDFQIALDVAVGTFGVYVRYITSEQSEQKVWE